MTDNAESVFARWSRLKRQQSVKAAARPQSGTAMAQSPSEDVAEATVSDRPKPPPAEKTPPDLPDIATLNKDSDFTLFLRGDVPEELHRRALRTLWRSDPIFSLRDGLTNYDEDYTAIGKVEQVVQTVYRVGQGYLATEFREQSPDGVRPAKSAPRGPGRGCERPANIGRCSGRGLIARPPAKDLDQRSARPSQKFSLLKGNSLVVIICPIQIFKKEIIKIRKM